MKKQILSGLMTLWAGVVLADVTSSYTFSANQIIPDANPTGFAFYTNLTISGGAITDVKLTLNLTNGFNGDLYAYLAGPNGGFAVALNRVGVSNNPSAFGYSDAGMNITLSDDAANDAHYYRNFSYLLNGGGQLTGNWLPDGRNIDPLSTPPSFLSAGQTAMLSSFDGLNPNGTWTLFLADLSGGSVSTLESWGLDVTVPEPSPMALVAGGLVIFIFARRFKSPRLNRLLK